MVKFVWRGKTWEELEKMDLKDFAGLLTARERRSLKRGFTEDQKKLLASARKDRSKFHRTKSRDMVIVPAKTDRCTVLVPVGVVNVPHWLFETTERPAILSEE